VLLKDSLGKKLEELFSIGKVLRKECPWDSAQDLDSIKYTLREEAYEVIETIEEKDLGHMKEELGDLLFNVFFLSIIAEEETAFTIEDVVDGIISKLIKRHPHVFGDVKVDSAEAALASWEKAKSKENKRLMDVPLNLPALVLAQKVQNRAKGLVLTGMTILALGKD
jgi:Protein containing tetrapyrrole methyltransferase domain and MazG-like (predicted pyrophosphatase) domain